MLSAKHGERGRGVKRSESLLQFKLRHHPSWGQGAARMLARLGLVLYLLAIVSGVYAVVIAAFAMIFGNDPDRILQYVPVAALGVVIILIGWACRQALASLTSHQTAKTRP
jgi:hypothetical protein